MVGCLNWVLIQFRHVKPRPFFELFVLSSSWLTSSSESGASRPISAFERFKREKKHEEIYDSAREVQRRNMKRFSKRRFRDWFKDRDGKGEGGELGRGIVRRLVNNLGNVGDFSFKVARGSSGIWIDGGRSFFDKEEDMGLGFCDVSIREWRVWEVKGATSFWFKVEVLSKKCEIWWDFLASVGGKSLMVCAWERTMAV